jgi:hypothetical protein
LMLYWSAREKGQVFNRGKRVRKSIRHLILAFVVASVLAGCCAPPSPVPAREAVEVEAEPAPTDTLEPPEPPALSLVGHSTVVTLEGLPGSSQLVFPVGTPAVYTVFDYAGLSRGRVWSVVWLRNGDVYDETGELVWDEAPEGQGEVLLAALDDTGLAAGDYEVQVLVDGEVVLSDEFSVVTAAEVLEAIESAEEPPEMIFALWSAFCISGLHELGSYIPSSDNWLALADAQLNDVVTTVESVYLGALNLAAEDSGLGSVELDIDLEDALFYLEQDIAAALEDPGNPDSAFYLLLLGGREYTYFEPAEELTVLEAILLTHWFMGGTCSARKQTPVSASTAVTPTATPTVIPTAIPRTKAYIFVGSTAGKKPGAKGLASKLNGVIFPSEVEKARASLTRYFQSKGWKVTVLEGAGASSKSFVKVVKEPGVAAVAFIGHADVGQLTFAGDYLDVRDVPDLANTGKGLNEVILLGCLTGAKDKARKTTFAALLVKDPATQSVSTKQKIGPFDISRIAKAIESGTPLGKVDTSPGAVEKTGQWVRKQAGKLRKFVKSLPRGTGSSGGSTSGWKQSFQPFYDPEHPFRVEPVYP